VSDLVLSQVHHEAHILQLRAKNLELGLL